MTNDATTALSGDVEGMASSHPEAAFGAAVPAPVSAPKGRMPASNPPSVQPSAPPPAAQAGAQSAAPGASPAGASDDPFAAELQARQQAPDSSASAPIDDPFAAELQARQAPPVVTPGKSDMQNFVSANLTAHRAAQPDLSTTNGANATTIAPEDPIHDFFHAFTAGLQISTSGLAIRGKMPDTILPEHADMAMRIANQLGTLAGDVPAMVAGMVGGGAAGTAVPVVGNVVGAAAGAFALPAAIRKMYIDHYTNGNISDAENPAREFASRLMATTWEGVKGGATGAAAALTGGAVTPVAGKLVGTAAELAAMTTVGSAVEGHLPSLQDFADGALLMGTLHGLGHVTGLGVADPKLTDAGEKQKNIFAATGETPAQITQAASTDVTLKQDLIAGNAQEPPQATPTKLVQRSEMIDTRGGGQQFHGANNPIDEVTPGHWNYNDKNIYGQGLYTTDAADVARGYAGNKPGTSPTMYEAKETTPANLLDLEKPMPNDVRSYLESFGKREFPGSRGDLIDAALKEDPKNLRAFYDEIRAESSQHGYTTHDVQEAIFMPLQDKLQAMGYDGIQHEGGRATGTNAHQVKIYFTPEKNLSLSAVDAEKFRKPPEIQPKAPEEVGAGDRLPPKNPPDQSLATADKVAYAEQYFDSKVGQNGEAPPATWRDSFKKWYANAVDYLAPIRDAVGLAKERGADINEENNSENFMRDSKDFATKAALMMSEGTRDAKTNAINGEGLDQIFKDMHEAGGTTEGYRRFAMAADALGDTKNESGLDLEQAKTIKDAYGAQYQEFHDRINDFRGRMLDWAADKGYLARDAVEGYKAMEDYSPRKRAFEADVFGEEKGTGGNAIQSRVGSERDILDPVMQTKLDTERLVRKVLVNESRSLFVDNMDAGDLIDKDGKWADTSMPPVLKAVDDTGPLKDNQVRRLVDGVGERYEGSELTIDSLRRLEGNPAALDLTAKILRGFTNTVRLGVVSNPAFGLAHFIRGQIMAGVNSATGLLPFQALGSLGDVVGNSPAFRDFLSAGGGGAGRFLDENHGYLASDLAKEDNAAAPWYGKAWNSALNPLRWSEGFIRLTDTATKFAEHQRSLEQGAGPREAMANTRLVTPDYSNVGLQQSVLRTGVAFIGAHINSLDNMAKVAQRDPVGVAMRMSVMMGMSAGLWYLNKDDEAIDAVPDWQKNTYWNINVSRFDPDYKGPQDATILRIPKPWAPGIVFGSGTEQVLDAWFKYRPQELPHFASSLMKSVVPDVVPNILQPVLDQYSNKQSFTGRPLVPFYKEKLLPEMQYSAYTSETAKAIGKLIGYVPLVKDIGPSEDPLASPAVVENYIKGWGGTMGGWALQLSDAALKKAGVGPQADKAAPWEDTPILHSFVSRYPSFQDQRIQDFYENRDEADKAYNSIKAASKAGDFAAAQAMQEAHPDFQVRLDGISKAISAARKTYDNVQSDPNIPNVQKRQNLDAILFQIGSMAKSGNQMMSDFQKAAVQNVVKGQGGQ